MTEWWAQATYPPLHQPITDKTADAMVNALPGFGIATATPARTLIEMAIDADNLAAALAAAATAGDAAWHAAGGDGDAVGIRVVTAAEHERELAHPEPIDLIGLTGIADQFGVTKQRADEITALAGFPDPIGTTPAGRVWSTRSVDEFAKTWERKRGRPAKR